MKTLKDFHNQYQLNKTLRFRLEPIGKTDEFISRAQVLESDERLAHEYVKVKKLIDDYHRHFISTALDENGDIIKVNTTGKNDSLEEFFTVYNDTSNDKRSADLELIETNFRKQIVERFKRQTVFARLFKKELIREDLPVFLKNKNDETGVELVAHFHDFNTYFVGFYENRKNIYTEEAKSTGIAFRLINQNLIKYVDNINVFGKVATILGEDIIGQINDDFKEYLDEIKIDSVADLFKIANYNKVLTQRRIDIYNAILRGRIDEGNATEIKGINQYVNEHNQTADKSARLPKFKTLYNQILSDKKGISFADEQFASASQVIDSILDAYTSLNADVFGKLKELLISLPTYNLDGIFLSNDAKKDSGLTTIAQRHYGAYDKITSALVAEYDVLKPRRPSQKQEKRDEEVKKYIKSIKSVSLSKIDSLLKDSTGKTVLDYFLKLGAVDNEYTQRENHFALIENRYNELYRILSAAPASDELLRKNITVIKDLLDAVKELQWFVKPLVGSGEEAEKDEVFYGDFTPLYETLSETITPLYNKVRNYITKKPYSLDKFKLNFYNSTLLDGWDVNKELDNLCVILRKGAEYYLAIAKEQDKKAIKLINQALDVKADDYFEKLNYKLLPSPFRMLPKVFFSKKGLDTFRPSKEILDIYNDGSFKFGDNFSRQSLWKLIDFYKQNIPKYESWTSFDFKFRKTEEYNSINEFFNDIDVAGYKLDFKNVPSELIYKLNEQGLLYLFKIAGKDFSPHSKGRPNLHTIYWRMLFDKRNLESGVYQLNGQAEVFFRRKSLSNTTIHYANKPLENKSQYNKENRPFSTFAYDIIKDRRFTRNQYEFHVPITMNYKESKVANLNKSVHRLLREGGVRHIIGIDRGERHLLYLTMIDTNGKIVKQFSLNEIAGNPNNPDFKQDFNALLAKKEDDRMESRRNWTTIENIKELKEGYLSLIVHTLATMMIENDAILVLENLNTGFIRGRQKVEKSVYQKFEKMLIDKLNYIVDKTADVDAPGGALKAIQLTDPYADFNKYQKGNVRQCGFLFYIPAWNTSKTDPSTGFVNLFDTRLDSIGEIKSFFSKFDRIKYNAAADTFEFSFDYSNFTGRGEGSRTRWTINTYGDRIFTHRSNGQIHEFVSETVNPTSMLKEVFAKIGAELTGNLKEAIASIGDLDTCRELLHAFKLTMQMRNSVTGTNIDYLISPAIGADGKNFDSRLIDDSMPNNADANGAYNIARKGLMLVNQIRQTGEDEKIEFDVTNKAWLNFAQSHNG